MFIKFFILKFYKIQNFEVKCSNFQHNKLDDYIFEILNLLIIADLNKWSVLGQTTHLMQLSVMPGNVIKYMFLLSI
jgi:hypothetical protein